MYLSVAYSLINQDPIRVIFLFKVSYKSYYILFEKNVKEGSIIFYQS